MPTIENAVDVLKVRLKKVDETKQFHEETIRFAMSFVWNQLIVDAYQKKGVKSLDFYSKEYKNQTATLDEDTLEYYIELPAAIICADDIDIAHGVRNLKYLADRSLDFIPVNSKNHSLYYGQDVYNVYNKIRYMVRHDRIIFVSGINDANKAIFTNTGIRFDLIVSLDEYGYTENFIAPGGKYEDFLLKTVNYLIGTPPVDLLNNNA